MGDSRQFNWTIVVASFREGRRLQLPRMKQFLHPRKYSPDIASRGKQENNRSTSPADIARARKLAKAKSWEDRFDFCLREDERALRVFNRILKHGINRRNLIAFFEAATDPQTGVRLQRLLPAEGEAQALVGRSKKTAKQLKSFWRGATIFALILPRERAAALMSTIAK
jgi:hypothetical protein